MINDLLASQYIETVYFECYLNYYDVVPNDQVYPYQNFDHINVEAAWEYTTGDPNIVVGIIDNGTDWNHSELKKGNDNYGNIFINYHDPWDYPDDPGSGDGIDDDHNGELIDLYYDYIADDFKGFNFKDWNCDVLPTGSSEFHGTAMSGLVGAKTNNGEQISGIAGGWWPDNPGVRILPVKNGFDAPASIPSAVGIRYAVFMGARILNFSWGHSEPFGDIIEEQIEFAHDYGVLMFAATGNDDAMVVDWPARLENVIAVGAVDHLGDCKSDDSNWGTETELTGVGWTKSIRHDGGYETFHGETSPACATASGAAALILSYNPCLSLYEVRYILKSTAKDEDDLDCGYSWNNGHCDKLGYGIIDLGAAFQEIDNNYPRTEEQTLTATTEWNSKKWVIGDITIDAGITLTITDTVVMDMEKKIIVERGGKLILDGGIITTTCQNFWGGIVVYGQNNQPQTAPYNEQGYVKIKNGGKIEKAEYGLYVCGPGPDDGGGIVIAEEAEFVNNKYAVHFEDYAPQNLSYFKNCSFKNNEYFIPNEIPWFDITEKAYPYYFVELYKVNYIRFLGCEFKNETGNDRPFGNGIYSYNSNFVVDGVCNNTSNPCTDWDPGLFKKLQYAIYVNNSISTKTFSVQSCNFIHNHRGIYASHISDVKILSNNFQIKPLQGAFGFIYGIYLNQNCFDFHIENNYFYSSTYERSSTGLYIRNASIYPNWVHNNTFGHLQYGSVADGINRNHYTETGLCSKCNNFDDCEYDIRVVGNAGEEGEGEKNNDGIAEIQGAFIPNVPCDTCPAGNLFTDDDNILIDNFENNIQNLEIMYIHHENISIFPLVPTPGEGVTPVTYEFVDYDPASSCPSWINTSNPHKGAGEKIAEMEDEKFKADSVQTVLNLLVDGGNTENLAQEVNTSMPQDALEVRNELMGESPYLSDSVMKAAIYKENVLPNVMIRDVLVANPQAAKSEEVMGAIDERYNTMPEYMKYEILQGQDIFGAKEMKEMEIGRYQTGYNNLFQSLLNTYRHDTVNQWPADSIVNLLNRVNTRGSKYLLIVHYLEQHQYTEAVQTLQQVGMQFEQTEREEEENADFETLIGILTSIYTGNIALDELDTSMVNTLMDLYERDYYMPGGMARNLLIQGGYIDYHEPFNDGGGLKSSMVKPVDYSKKPENMDVRLNVFPNPGKDYIIVEHEVIIPFELLEIKIYDLHGREIISFHSNKDIDQQVVDFTNYPAGSYLATILINRKQVKSKKFSIVK